MGRIRPYNKHDPIIGRDLTAAERLEPARAALRLAAKLIEQAERTAENASNLLTEAELETVCRAAEQAVRAAENAAFLGVSGYIAHPVERVAWEDSRA